LANIRLAEYKLNDVTHIQEKAKREARFLANSAAKWHNQNWAWLGAGKAVARCKTWVYGRSHPVRILLMVWKSVVSFLCCEVELSVSGWSLVQRRPTECGAYQCDSEVSIMRRPWSTRGCCTTRGVGNCKGRCTAETFCYMETQYEKCRIQL